MHHLGADQLSLPVSMTFGFGMIGLAGLIFIASKGNLRFDRESLFHPLRIRGMQSFLKQLSASATETAVIFRINCSPSGF